MSERRPARPASTTKHTPSGEEKASQTPAGTPSTPPAPTNLVPLTPPPSPPPAKK